MKRRIFILAIFLLAGAFVNVAVAAYCALYVVGAELYNIFPSLKRPERASPAEMSWLDARGWKSQRDDLAVTWAQLTAPGFTRREYFEIPRSYFEPWWGGGSGGSHISFATRTTAGLPLKSFEVEEWLDQELLTTRHEVAYECNGGVHVKVEVDIGGPIDLPRPLPCRPLLFGFAVNTIIYATFLWLLILGPFVVRWFVRVRRGRCPKCAYPMGESDVCSECGKSLPRRVLSS